ncbi:MAG: ZIP family metal transporter [Flavobacteriia bacterium]|nr:ZIP family metal transporter [Flavobacteriia bacterium]
MKFILDISLLITAVIIGGIVVTWLEKVNQKKMIQLLLAFSGGFLLCIAFVHFLPELYHQNEETIGFYVLLGFLVQLFLEYFSGGIEHGHIHHHHQSHFPWVLFFSLSVHSFIEGIPLANEELIHHHGHNHDDHSLLYGIVFHQIPVSIALMTVFKIQQMKNLNAWFMLLVFSLMTPLGLLCGFWLGEYFQAETLQNILALVVGMFLHISTTIIFETSENHRFNLTKLLYILIGVILGFWIK